MGDTECKKQPVENIEDYNTVRISCHGEYNTEQTVIVNTSHSISDPITFHIFFRARPGQCVLARTQSMRLENQDFGADTYTKEFIISINRDNFTDKSIEYLQTDKNISIPAKICRHILMTLDNKYKPKYQVIDIRNKCKYIIICLSVYV